MLFTFKPLACMPAADTMVMLRQLHGALTAKQSYFSSCCMHTLVDVPAASGCQHCGVCCCRSLPAPAESFVIAVSARVASEPEAAAATGRRRVRRVAFSPDLGVPPVEAEVIALCRAAAEWWQHQGAELVEAAPDLQDMQEVFLVSSSAQWNWLLVCDWDAQSQEASVQQCMRTAAAVLCVIMTDVLCWRLGCRGCALCHPGLWLIMCSARLSCSSV